MEGAELGGGGELIGLPTCNDVLEYLVSHFKCCFTASNPAWYSQPRQELWLRCSRSRQGTGCQFTQNPNFQNMFWTPFPRKKTSSLTCIKMPASSRVKDTENTATLRYSLSFVLCYLPWRLPIFLPYISCNNFKSNAVFLMNSSPGPWRQYITTWYKIAKTCWNGLQSTHYCKFVIYAALLGQHVSENMNEDTVFI